MKSRCLHEPLTICQTSRHAAYRQLFQACAQVNCTIQKDTILVPEPGGHDADIQHLDDVYDDVYDDMECTGPLHDTENPPVIMPN